MDDPELKPSKAGDSRYQELSGSLDYDVLMGKAPQPGSHNGATSPSTSTKSTAGNILLGCALFALLFGIIAYFLFSPLLVRT